MRTRPEGSVLTVMVPLAHLRSLLRFRSGWAAMDSLEISGAALGRSASVCCVEMGPGTSGTWRSSARGFAGTEMNFQT